MSKILMSVGPIPAMLDSVKVLTNKFKGGLALKTAKKLIVKGHELTIVKWRHTPELNDTSSKMEYVNVDDVRDYYDKMKSMAPGYDAVVLAGAIANLMPVNPWKGKFPSHEYSEGDKFNIEFTIAPRIINMIKDVHPRCCLIGYKLFDSKTDDELIEIAKHTRQESRSNVIFANTPREAKLRKIAVLADDSAIPMSFDQHIDFIDQAVRQKYFRTEIYKNDDKKVGAQEIELAKLLVEQFLMTTNNFGSIAVKLADGSIMTTGRGHKGIARVYDADLEKDIVVADKKATLNAPVLFKLSQKYDIVLHRHEQDAGLPSHQEYIFPGTKQEAELVEGSSNFEYHGYLKGTNFQEVNWLMYRDVFPEKYMGTTPAMQKYIDTVPENSLEVGGNSVCAAKYALDLHYTHPAATNIDYQDIETGKYKFDMIILRNSINYLTDDQIKLLIHCLTPSGKIIANTFINKPAGKVSLDEIAVCDENNIITHVLRKGNTYYKHNFRYISKTQFKAFGFNYKETSKHGAFLLYQNKE